MRKLNFYFVLAIMLMAFSACSSGEPGNKEITPTSLEFTSGEIARYVEFVDEPAILSFSEKDGFVKTQIFTLKAKMKKTKEGFEDVDYHDIEFGGAFYYAYVNLVDESGSKVQGVSMTTEGALALKKLLTGKVGDTAEITFNEDFMNSENSPKWFKSITGFTPNESANIIIKNNTSEASSSAGSEESSASAETEESAFPTDNVILPSSLKGKVEVTNVEKGIGRYGFPEVSVTFKLLKKVNTASLCSAGGQMWIVGVGQNEQGRDIKELLPNYGEWRSGDSDGSEFKDFLEGDPDDTITLDFTGDKDSSNDVSADLDKVKKFKLKLIK